MADDEGGCDKKVEGGSGEVREAEREGGRRMGLGIGGSQSGIDAGELR